MKRKQTGPRAPKRNMPLTGAISAYDFRCWQDFCNLTRKEFAKALGVSEMTVRRWRSGKVPVPKWLQDKREAAFRR